MPRTTTKSSHERGLGYQHRQDRELLLRQHHDGSPCPCLGLGDCGPACLCRPGGQGLPMYRDPSLNPDGMALEADHTLARSQGGKRPDRLLLATCNRSRGAGTRLSANDRPGWWTQEWVAPTPT